MNTGETSENGQDTPRESGQSSAEESGSTSTKTARTYTQEQYNKLSDKLAEQGRQNKETLEALTKERDELKSKYEASVQAVEESNTRIKDLETDIADLKSDLDLLDSSDISEIRKVRDQLRAKEKQLDQEHKDKVKAVDELKKQTEAERLEWAGTVSEARAAKFEVDVFEVAEEYVDDAGRQVNSEKLKAACKKANITKRKDIEELAGTLWTKKEESNDDDFEPDPGVTNGGGTKTREEKLKERYPSMN